jgi:lipoate-protein ligase A
LNAQGAPAALKIAADDTADATPGVCFQRAEVYDVIHPSTQAKIAGAAQKRNKRGLLLQGSISRAALASAAMEWDEFETDFARRLGAALAAEAQPIPWPEFNEDEVSGLIEQYASPEWIEHR